MKTQSIRILVLAVLAGAPCLAQVATNDLFNRPNGTNLGPDWIEQDGDAQIVSNQLQANSNFTYGWCSHSVYAANYANTVVRANWAMNGGGGDRIALIAGCNTANWSGIEVRIADNDGDGFADRIFFNAAVNAGAWYTSPSFVNMTSIMASGEATMWFTNGGDTVNIRLRDLVTSAIQVYSASGILANPPTGTRVGIGYFGNGTADDFRAWTGSPDSPVYTLTSPRSNGATTLLVTDALPNAGILIAYSGAGAGPIPTPLGIVGLSDPIELFLQTNADSAGRLEIPFGPLTLSPGLTVHTQAIDLSALLLTNYFTIVVL
jgi:hypothetical protein